MKKTLSQTSMKRLKEFVDKHFDGHIDTAINIVGNALHLIKDKEYTESNALTASFRHALNPNRPLL